MIVITLNSTYNPHKSLSLPQPSPHPISPGTQHLVCEEIVSTYNKNDNPCFDTGVKASIDKTEVLNYEVGHRDPNTNQMIYQNNYRKATVNLQINENQAIISGDIDEYINNIPFSVLVNNSKNLTASYFYNKPLATGSASLVLDKTKGFLTLSDNSSIMYCEDSLGVWTALYQCK